VVSGTNLLAGTYGAGVWKRPLSEFGSSGVGNTSQVQSTAASYPNPFSKSTTIHFSLSDRGYTQVVILNLLGSEVARLFAGELEAGEHSFTWYAREMPAGMYVCNIRSGGGVEELPLLLVR
jgi:hypothetical protein